MNTYRVTVLVEMEIEIEAMDLDDARYGGEQEVSDAMQAWDFPDHSIIDVRVEIDPEEMED